MDILFKNVTVFAPGSPNHLQTINIGLKNNQIAFPTGENITAGTIIDETDLWVSAGWFDMHAEISEPGFEHKEDSVSLAQAAAAGGFTEMLCFAYTEPLLQSKN